MELDLWDCFGRNKKDQTASYSQRNSVVMEYAAANNDNNNNNNHNNNNNNSISVSYLYLCLSTTTYIQL